MGQTLLPFLPSFSFQFQTQPGPDLRSFHIRDVRQEPDPGPAELPGRLPLTEAGGQTDDIPGLPHTHVRS